MTAALTVDRRRLRRPGRRGVGGGDAGRGGGPSCAAASPAPTRSSTEAARHLVEAGGKRFRPMLVALGAQFGDPTRAAGRAAPPWSGADPPGDALPRRRDGRGGRAARRAQRQRALGQLGGHPRRRLPVRPGRRHRRRARPRGGAPPGADVRPAGARPDRRDGRARAAPTRSSTTCTCIAEKTGSLIATSARFGGMFGGRRAGARRGARRVRRDDRHRLPALRRPARHRQSESVQSGKTPGTDLREGVPTLPVLYALAADDTDPASVRLREILAARPGHRRRAARRGAGAAARVARR